MFWVFGCVRELCVGDIVCVMMMMMMMKSNNTVLVFVGKIFNHISLEYGMVLYEYCTVLYA